MENKNHWQRDPATWREGRSVRRKPDGVKNLSLRRGTLLVLIPAAEFTSLSAASDYFKYHRNEAIHLLTRTSMSLASHSPCHSPSPVPLIIGAIGHQSYLLALPEPCRLTL